MTATEGGNVINEAVTAEFDGALAPERSSEQAAEVTASASEDESANEPVPAKKTEASSPEIDADQPRSRGLFANLFSASGQNADVSERTPLLASIGQSPAPSEANAESDQAAAPQAKPTEQQADAGRRPLLSAFFSPKSGIAEAEAAVEETQQDEASKPEQATKIVSLVSNQPEAKPTAMWDDPLPGVRDRKQLFEISYGSAKQDDGSFDLYEQVDTYQVAAAAGLARLAPNGLLKQRESVDVSCFKPQLVHMLKTIERHFGKPVMITSGYRSPQHNRRVRGARNSMHMQCAAADIQVAGVSKWELARFTRALASRGGVGTYCHTNSVHVDIGPRRDWNWRCRR